MLRTRLWVGALLIALVVGVLAIDSQFAPWFPILLALIAVLSLASTFELWRLLRVEQRPSLPLCLAGVSALVAANWLPHLVAGLDAWTLLSKTFAAVVLAVFLVEMATFRQPGASVVRMALAVWLVAYLGWLPSFLAQQRWLGPNLDWSTTALALTIFVPKCCDMGAYFTGRALGRHPMTPVLSPKKTWEGAAGGLTAAMVVAVALDRLCPAAPLGEELARELAFGLSVGLAGMLGDLAESLVKRDCQQKDASHAVPGFGGILDVVDAILFAAPVSYWWLT